MKAKTIIILLCSFLFWSGKNERKLIYNNTPMIHTEKSLSDALGAFSVDDLPVIENSIVNEQTLVF